MKLSKGKDLKMDQKEYDEVVERLIEARYTSEDALRLAKTIIELSKAGDFDCMKRGDME